jgi:predicted polyphosphate/ATP-dependent NAD kinase
MATVGILANPAAGKDVRRLVTHASPTSDAAKIGVVRRAVLGAIGGGATRIIVAPDRHRLSERAVDDLSADELGDATIEVFDEPVYGIRSDTVAVASRFAKEDVDALIVLGGDGTNRDVAKGWLEAPLVSISTGTNNVFPRSLDATLAGLGAGLIASGAVALDEASFRAKWISVRFDDGSPDDLALVDVAVIDSRFVGSRAVWDPAVLRSVVACIAEPASVGLSSIAALVASVSRREPGATVVELTNDPALRIGGVRALLAPGMFTPVSFSRCERLSTGDATPLHGPGMLAFDGERDRVLDAGVHATAELRADGPTVLDVERAIALAAARGHFLLPPSHHQN